MPIWVKNCSVQLPAPPIAVSRADIDAGTVDVRRPVNVRLGIGNHGWRDRSSQPVEMGRDHIPDAPTPIRRAPLSRTLGDLHDAAAWNDGHHPKGRARSLPQIGIGIDPRWSG